MAPSRSLLFGLIDKYRDHIEGRTCNCDFCSAWASDILHNLQARLIDLDANTELVKDLDAIRIAYAHSDTRAAKALEACKSAQAALDEYGCDCGTDEPGTCALCLLNAVVNPPRNAG